MLYFGSLKYSRKAGNHSPPYKHNRLKRFQSKNDDYNVVVHKTKRVGKSNFYSTLKR
jgi:hypothetical protein